MASRRDEIDWVLSDNRKTLTGDVSPEALKQRLTDRYFTDFAGAGWAFSTVSGLIRRTISLMSPTS